MANSETNLLDKYQVVQDDLDAYSKTYTATLKGVDANKITVETDLSNGVPVFNIIGLADKSINEAKERITAAMKASGYPSRPQRILVNLSPAHIKKEGAHLDLAIAATIMTSHEFINIKADFLESFCFLGELALTGETKSIIGLLSLALEAQKEKIKYLVVPKDNLKEASLIKLKENNQTEIFAISNLHDLKDLIESLYRREMMGEEENNNYKKYLVPKISKEQLLVCHCKSKRNIDDVIGQDQAKRGLEIAACGRHHTLMIGPPGCGKTMLAKRFISLLPQLDFDQALETTKIYSISGLLTKDILLDPPLRAPHHSASEVSLIGGGSNSKPGEVSLAHNGVLFLDELTEFNKKTIELLRQILEDKTITINRIKQSLSYPANFTLIAACNPCPCGYKGDPDNVCTCTSGAISKYINKLSGPILDRIDLHIELARLQVEEITSLSNRKQRTKKINTKILDAIKQGKAFANGLSKKTDDIYQLNDKACDFINNAVVNLKLSARSHQKIIKVARTIANLDESLSIEERHLAEAMQFRSIDWQKYRR